MGCSASPPPQVEDLIKTSQPTIEGSYNASLTAPATSFVVGGDCDTKSYGIEYSLNSGLIWLDAPNGCGANGKYSLTVTVNPRVHLQVRAKTKFGSTDASKALITLAVPPSSPIGVFATSSASHTEGEEGSQNTVTHAISSGPNGSLSSTSYNIDVGVLGAAFGN